MKTIISKGQNAVLTSEAKDGFIYAVISPNEKDLGIISKLADDEYAVTSIMAGREVDTYDEFGTQTLDGLLEALLDFGYGVFQFDSFDEFGNWGMLSDRALGYNKVEDNFTLRPDSIKKFNVLHTPTKTHIIDTIAGQGLSSPRIIAVRTLCGLGERFSLNGIQLNGHGDESNTGDRWYLSSVAEGTAGRPACRSCIFTKKAPLTWNSKSLDKVVTRRTITG